jgi:hypothetical protein
VFAGRAEAAERGREEKVARLHEKISLQPIRLHPRRQRSNFNALRGHGYIILLTRC